MMSSLLLGIALVLAFTTVVIMQKHYKTVVALKEIIADMEQNHKYQFQQFQGEHDKEVALLRKSIEKIATADVTVTHDLDEYRFHTYIAVPARWGKLFSQDMDVRQHVAEWLADDVRQKVTSGIFVSPVEDMQN